MSAGQTAVLAGGAGALGRAIAARLHAADVRVQLLGRRPADHPQVLAALNQIGPGAAYAQCDATDPAALDRLFSQLGDVRAAIYAAGITFPGPVLCASPAEIEATFRVNAVGAVHFATAAAKAMIASGKSGAILGISSWAENVPDPDDIVYGASKAALASFLRGLALTLGPHGIRVNSLAVGVVGGEGMAARHLATHPGYADRIAHAVPLGRLATAEEIADAACWLLSDRAAYVTGASLTVDGGASLRQDGGQQGRGG